MGPQHQLSSTFVGAKLLSISPIEKRDFLLFDQIATLDVNQQLRLLRDPAHRAEIEWLMDQQLVFDIDLSEIEARFPVAAIWPKRTPALGLWLMAAAFALVEAKAEFNSEGEAAQSLDPGEIDDAMFLLGSACTEGLDQSLGAIALAVEMTKGVSCTPIRDSPLADAALGINQNASALLNILESLPRHIRRHRLLSRIPMADDLRERLPVLRPILAAEKLLKQQIREESSILIDTKPALEIVLEALPVPDENVEWERVLEFRRDPDTRHSLLALRNWIRNVTGEGKKPSELREELEFLIAEYAQFMRLHKMKTQLATLKAVVSIPADILEHVLRLRFGSVVQTLFKVREVQIAGWEAEASAPGREVSYIVKTRETFRTP
jgi:hypothetical protein